MHLLLQIRFSKLNTMLCLLNIGLKQVKKIKIF